MLLLILSCNTKQKQIPPSYAPAVVEAHGYDRPEDSMDKPKVIAVTKPYVCHLGKPEIVPTNTNIHPAGTPQIIIAGVLRKCTPGQDTFSLPKKVPSIENTFLAGIPEVVIAKELYTKDKTPKTLAHLANCKV